MSHPPRLLLAALTLLTVCPLASAAEKPGARANKPVETGELDASGAYHLSAEELSYDCKRLSGRMQVRLMQIRSYDPSRAPSDISRTLQKTTEPATTLLLGKSSTYGADPTGQYRKDVAMLRAYNAQLASKGCKTYDLDAALKQPAPGQPAAPPRPANAPAPPQQR